MIELRKRFCSTKLRRMDKKTRSRHYPTFELQLSYLFSWYLSPPPLALFPLLSSPLRTPTRPPLNKVSRCAALKISEFPNHLSYLVKVWFSPVLNSAEQRVAENIHACCSATNEKYYWKHCQCMLARKRSREFKGQWHFSMIDEIRFAY